MDDAPVEPSAGDPVEVADLKRTVAVLAGEVQTLADRVARLSHVVDELGPRPSGRPAPVVPAGGSKGKPERFRVVVSPVAELALAAVAETSLRALAPVRRVLEVSRSDSEARFELEVEADADMVEPLRAALPVPFEVVSAEEGELVIALRPAWGPAASS